MQSTVIENARFQEVTWGRLLHTSANRRLHLQMGNQQWNLNERVLEPKLWRWQLQVEAAIKRFLELGVPQIKLFGLVQGVELVKKEAEKSKMRAAAYGLNSTTIVNTDFFKYLAKMNGQGRFDVVVGNPPFIRYQDFPEAHRDKAFAMMEGMGLSPNKLTNIWVPFLVLSSNALNKYGKLGEWSFLWNYFK